MEPVIKTRLSELNLIGDRYPIKELDVRPILEHKGEPYDQIMETFQSLKEGGVLILHTTFKPLPLLGVFKAKGMNSDSLVIGKKHHVTIFYPKE